MRPNTGIDKAMGGEAVVFWMYVEGRAKICGGTGYGV